MIVIAWIIVSMILLDFVVFASGNEEHKLRDVLHGNIVVRRCPGNNDYNERMLAMSESVIDFVIALLIEIRAELYLSAEMQRKVDSAITLLKESELL